MVILRAKFTEVWFEDAIGDRRKIRGLPLGRRRRFLELQELAGVIIQENPDCSIGLIYDWDADFRDAIDESLSLYGLSPDWCSAAQVMQLFYAYEGGSGLCWQIEFPESDKPTKGKMLSPETDPYHASIAAIWSYSPELSLSEVIESIADIPWIDVEGITAERNRQAEEADPELKKKREQQDDFAEMGDRFAEALESGEFADGFSAGLALV